MSNMKKVAKKMSNLKDLLRAYTGGFSLLLLSGIVFLTLICAALFKGAGFKR